jgi:CheY-like chemotaxis protein
LLAVDENLSMAQRLMALSGGSLLVHSRGGVTLTLPLAQPAPVLLIDDNQDALQLFQRYLTGTRYHPVVTRDPVEGLALAQEMMPQTILVDVMLPGMDGWEVLARLRRHPATERIPVIICTILPEEQLAWSLGASGFLRKPLARDELLKTLQTAKPRVS